MKTMKLNKPQSQTNLGFTIVELLIVIVIIGILAAITIVSYINISKKATEAGLISDLDGAKRQLELYKVEHGTYPTTMDNDECPTAPTNDPKYCLKNKSFEYTSTDGSTYTLRLTKSDVTYEVTNDTTPKLADILPESDWITIGTQRWARKNLNIGTRINGNVAQTNNGGTNVVEKYCYGDNEANCTSNDNGGLYQWNEAMGYTNTEGAQGICPVGSHIPSDNEWKNLEMQLGMTQTQADMRDVYRGLDHYSQLEFGGSSNLNVPLGGFRGNSGAFISLSTQAYLWSSSISGGTSWARALDKTETGVFRYVTNDVGFSVRCLGN